MTTISPVPLQYFPVVQAVQSPTAASPVDALKVPWEQGVGLFERAGQSDPAGHVVIAWLPNLGQEFPAVHDLHELCPVVSW